eukprot:CAMPEP_0170509620 /NCGR_PEP_ID=MMETSP0208-20121228/65314_1 /TAXON_ID=197538 /ORGANISM="Strombidium inclinatum, Strain S3" /LENGTH=257 /DNA_ID=CAMNT_0010793001 /DNA_START=312 /DNA_END=1085 /DNA_ORIENTATION=+
MASLSLNVRLAVILLSYLKDLQLAQAIEDKADKVDSLSKSLTQIDFTMVCILINSLLSFSFVDNMFYKVAYGITTSIAVIISLVVIVLSATIINNIGLVFGHGLLNALLVTIGSMASYINVQHNRINLKYSMAQKEQNEQYKRMIDAIDEAMLVVSNGRVSFSNRVADDILMERLEGDTDKKVFYIFKDSNLEGNRSGTQDCLTPDFDKRSSCNSIVSLSVNQVLQIEKQRLDSLVFTFSSSSAANSPDNNMHQILD